MLKEWNELLALTGWIIKHGLVEGQMETLYKRGIIAFKKNSNSNNIIRPNFSTIFHSSFHSSVLPTPALTIIIIFKATVEREATVWFCDRSIDCTSLPPHSPWSIRTLTYTIHLFFFLFCFEHRWGKCGGVTGLAFIWLKVLIRPWGDARILLITVWVFSDCLPRDFLPDTICTFFFVILLPTTVGLKIKNDKIWCAVCEDQLDEGEDRSAYSRYLWKPQGEDLRLLVESIHRGHWCRTVFIIVLAVKNTFFLPF